VKVLFVGDAGCPTGFSRCTHAVCDDLHLNGHDLAILGMNYFGLTGLPDTSYPYPIYSDGHRWDGGDTVPRLSILIDRLRPDIVVMLNDPWNIPGYQYFYEQVREGGHRPLFVAWLAVDSKNQKAEHLNRLDHVIVWTQFAVDELRTGGYSGPISIVPLGVDSDLFHPMDKRECRAKICPQLSDDAYIVGYVGRNQGRKRIDLLIEYFAEWVNFNEHDNAYLLLHLSPTGEMGCDIESIAKYHGVGKHVLVSRAVTGQITDSGVLPLIYNSMDVFMTTSQAEGFCLPVLEAMACNIPCIVPEWAAFDRRTGAFPEGSVLRVPCTSIALTGPTNGTRTGPWTIGGIADKQGAVKALETVYEATEMGMISRMIVQGRKKAESLSWKRCGESFRLILEEIVQ
jgi:glycosyltransferase involved in cell wall biosynthesis